MKRKFPSIVFVVLVILNLLNILLFFVEGINRDIAGLVLEALIGSVFMGGLIYLILPAFIYFKLSKENSKKNRTGYITAIVTLTLQVVFSGPTSIFIALLCMEGAYYWISFIYYGIAALLTIVAIIYGKKCLKANRKNA